MADLGGRQGTTNIMPGRGLINPAFVIKIVAATDMLQGDKVPPRSNPSDDFLSNLVVGDEVHAKNEGKELAGTVNRIIKNSLGDVTYVVITDDNGKTHKIESSRVRVNKKFRNDQDDDSLVSSPAMFNESKVFSFYEFLNQTYL